VSASILTERELEVLRWIGKGATNRQIAESLTLSDATVRVHVHNILAKLSLENRNQIMAYALREGLVPR
jgi:DNA-binding NarL/FixJ family response regulator